MKEIGIAAATGALFGALAAWALVPRTAASDTGASELAAAVGEMKEAVGLLRRSIESGRTLAAARPESAPPVATTEARRPSPSVSDDPAPPPTPDAPVASPGPAARASLQELRGFEPETGIGEEAVEARKKGGVRERWLFASERDVRAAFGAPDEVIVSDNSENWTYLLPVRSEDESDRLVLVFSRGRLVQIW